MIKIPPLEFWSVFKNTVGAFSTAEAIALFNVACAAPIGLAAELGTHKGKSSLVIAIALRDMTRLALVEPEFKNDIWRDGVFVAINAINPRVQLSMVAAYSINIIPYFEPLAFVFVDSGSHGDGLPMQEAKMLEDRMVQGGIIAFHDYKNQFTEVEVAYNYLLSTGKYEKIGINWEEIFDYVKEHNLEEGNNSWHLYPELPHPPNFVGALKRK